ncbi:hypothetical protein TrLO_g6130 [Triparma laevis f. longispina]|uniref:Uncharacterized protein n=1 Tax=Triparma laevis f. longispina TaxID=1714387 RepID=A0A9W7E5L4_9STRA|nr:hypothetical protein TrLO_g6130 [Triparma laevis f. longispina]
MSSSSSLPPAPPPGSTLSDLAVLHYLQSRGYHSAATSLHTALGTAGTEGGALKRNVEGLLGGGGGYGLDASVEVVFWGLAKGNGSEMQKSFEHFADQIISLAHHGRNDLLSLLSVTLCHCCLSLLEVNFPDHHRELYKKYEPTLSPFYPQISELEKISNYSQFVDSVSHASNLRGQISEVKKKMSQLSSHSVNVGGEAGRILDAAKRDEKVQMDELEKKLSGHLQILSTTPFLARLRAQRAHITLTVTSNEILHSLLSSSACAPIAAIIFTRCVIGVGDVKGCVVLEDSVDANEGVVDPNIRWAAPFPQALRAGLENGQTTQLPFPDFSEDFSEGILRGIRKEGAVERDNLIRSTPNITHKLKNPVAPMQGSAAYDVDGGCFKPNVCEFRVGEGGVVIKDGGAGKIGNIGGTSSIKISPNDGSRVAVGGGDGVVRVFRLEKGGSNRSGNKRKKTTFKQTETVVTSSSPQLLIGHQHSAPVYGLSWFKDGRSLLSAGGDGSVRLWDTSLAGFEGGQGGPTGGGAQLAVYKGHVGDTGVNDVAVCDAGYFFATAGSDATARLWTTDRTVPVRLFAGHLSHVNTVAWHPNCNYIATGSDDHTVRLWDVQSGKAVRLLSGFYGPVTSLAFCPSGRNVSAADSRGVVSCFDIGTGKKINDLRPSSKLTHIYSLSYSKCGSALAAGGESNIRVYDVRRGREAEGGTGPVRDMNANGPVMDCAFSPGNLLFAGTKG